MGHRGAALVEQFRGTNIVPGGVIGVCDSNGVECVPLLHTFLGALGPVEGEGIAFYADEILRGLDQSGDLDGPQIQQLKDAAAAHNVVLVVGLGVKDQRLAGVMRNASLVITPVGIEGVYIKVHQWHNEKLYARGGKRRLFSKLQQGRPAWDQRFMGRSCAIAPDGRVVGHLDHDREDALRVVLDLDDIARYRAATGTWADRVPELYAKYAHSVEKN
ncbi:hypothetical protein BRY73_03490 [Ochrobactrum sp. P6BS-III]|uniref:M81 family metallopeptidase n=1 Tax=unclassified Ochrobactrum TaxID=239106 RepID=UPI00099192E9|nr:putative amidohydrolase [Ochrobactrum sp. P6BSIII]OOL20228.1 hypothetical protein BRY73_03490 [Ochrobactrum sp. P6BS-III]